MTYTEEYSNQLWRRFYFENVQQTRLLHDAVAQRVEAFISFSHYFNHQIVGSKSNLPSKEMAEVLREHLILAAGGIILCFDFLITCWIGSFTPDCRFINICLRKLLILALTNIDKGHRIYPWLQIYQYLFEEVAHSCTYKHW